MPDLPDRVAVSVVATEHHRLAEAHPYGVAPTLVERHNRIERRGAGSFTGCDNRQDALRSQVRHVTVDGDSDVPHLRPLSRHEVLLVVAKQLRLLVEAVVRVPVQIPHQVIRGKALAHLLHVETAIRRPPLPVDAPDLVDVGLSVAHRAASPPSLSLVLRSCANTTGSIRSAPRSRSSKFST